MTDYSTYQVEDFAIDDTFIVWCLNPTDGTELFWTQWMENNPSKRSIVFEARQMVQDLHAIQDLDTVSNFTREIWNEIEQNIIVESPKAKPTFTLNYSFAIAALVVFCLAFVAIGFTTDFWVTPRLHSESKWVNYQNNSSLTKTIILDDSSKVILEPFSSLKYPKLFSDDQRIVFLKGEAFFDVERDTLRPFLVYANQTITKVLGTSFKISAFEGQKTVEVDVISGKVAVYANVNAPGNRKNQKQIVIEADEKIFVPLPNKKIEVTPNQRVVFNQQLEDMRKMISTSPRLIETKENNAGFVFKDEPVAKIFDALENAYGIELEYDDEVLSECTITTVLDDEPLIQKLTIICAALNLTFNEDNAKIYIEGEGCNQ